MTFFDSLRRLREITRDDLQIDYPGGNRIRLIFRPTKRNVRSINRAMYFTAIGRFQTQVTHIEFSIGTDNRQGGKYSAEFNYLPDFLNFFSQYFLARTDHVFDDETLNNFRQNFITHMTDLESPDNSGTSDVLDDFWDDSDNQWASIIFTFDDDERRNLVNFFRYQQPADENVIVEDREFANYLITEVLVFLRGRGISPISIENLPNLLTVSGGNINRQRNLAFYLDQINSSLGTFYYYDD